MGSGKMPRVSTDRQHVCDSAQLHHVCVCMSRSCKKRVRSHSSPTDFERHAILAGVKGKDLKR